MAISISPRFDTEGNLNALRIPSRDLNTVMTKEYHDDLDMYQRMFGLYSFMPLRYDYKFILHTPTSHPWVVQPKTACSYNPLMGVTMGRREIEPCKAYIHGKQCYDEFFDSCFRQLVEWTPDGRVGLGEDGRAVLMAMVDEVLRNAALGLRVTLTSGQLYNIAEAVYKANTPISIKDAFNTTINSCRGWIKLFVDLAASGFDWLNIDGLIPDELINGTCSDFNGSILTLFDNLRCNARPELGMLINAGGVANGRGNVFRALFVVSSTIYNGLANEFRAQSQLTAQNNPRISRVQVNNNALFPEYVYMIDNVPVIPLTDINIPDTVLAGQTHFAGIIASGNIQLGLSFDSIPTNIQTDRIGMRIEQITTNENGNEGQYVFTSDFLLATALADPNYAVATVNYVTP